MEFTGGGSGVTLLAGWLLMQPDPGKVGSYTGCESFPSTLCLSQVNVTCYRLVCREIENLQLLSGEGLAVERVWKSLCSGNWCFYMT